MSDRVPRGLARLSAQSIAGAYELWLEAQVDLAQRLANEPEERRRIAERAEIAAKALQAARDFVPPAGGEPEAKPAKRKKGAGKKGKAAGASRALGATDPLARLAAEAKARAEAVRKESEAKLTADIETARRRLADARRDVIAVVRRTLALVRPRLAVKVIPVAGGRAVVHAERPLEDDSVLLLALFTGGKVPSRHGFFADDTVDDPELAPPHFYAELGVVETRPSPDAEEALCDDAHRDVLPAKAFLPMPLEGRSRPRFRLVNRGPVAEFELRREGSTGYESVMPRAEAELLSGYLIALQAKKRLQLAIEIE